VSAVKIITAITGTLTALGGLLLAINNFVKDEPAAPQPITTIIIQQPGDYQEFVDSTELEYYENLKR